MSGISGRRSWDPWKMYDVSQDEIKAMQERSKMRAAMKAEFQKKYSNPFKASAGEGGHIFDPAIQRFMSMNASNLDHFKVTPKTSFQGFALFVGPVILFSYFIYNERVAREKKYRSGAVPYKDRSMKFIY